MKKYGVLSVVLLAIFMISLVFMGILQAAEVAYIEGNVQVQPVSEKTWKKAELGMQVNIGDSIRTARRSKVDIILDKARKHSIRVEGNTLLVLNSSYPGAINKIDLSHGKVFADVEQVMAGFNFEVTTPSSVAGVRGTGYSVDSIQRRDEVAVYKDAAYVQTFDAQRNLIAETNIPEGFKTQIERFEAAGSLTEVTVREMDRWTEVKQDLSQRVEEGPAKQEEQKKEEPKSEIEQQVQQVQDTVELSTDKTTESKQQSEEREGEKIVEEIRKPDAGGCGGS